jgi:hypothetical protein
MSGLTLEPGTSEALKMANLYTTALRVLEAERGARPSEERRPTVVAVHGCLTTPSPFPGQVWVCTGHFNLSRAEGHLSRI